MSLDGHQHAEAGQQSHHGCPAVTNQGQGYSNHWQYADDHASIDEHVDKKSQGQRPAQKSAVLVLGLYHNVEAARQNKQVNCQQPQASQ